MYCEMVGEEHASDATGVCGWCVFSVVANEQVEHVHHVAVGVPKRDPGAPERDQCVANEHPCSLMAWPWWAGGMLLVGLGTKW